MARMIPANLSLKTDSKAEEKLFYALRDSLDDSHTVFHSFDLPVRNLQNKLIDAEIDFLIFQQKYIKGTKLNNYSSQPDPCSLLSLTRSSKTPTDITTYF